MLSKGKAIAPRVELLFWHVGEAGLGGIHLAGAASLRSCHTMTNAGHGDMLVSMHPTFINDIAIREEFRN
jgi:hypothetical protein